MPDQNPFAPSSKLAFLTGLATSTMGAFKEDYDRRRKEDEQKKQMDYQLLMDALKMRVQTGNITPTEMNEILTRGVDIFKPQGHGGIKEQLGQIFGGGKPYEPQAGNILASAKPKADIKVEGQTEPIEFGGGVTLPPPPPMTYHEPTLREQDLQEKEKTYGFQLDKALAIEDARDAHRQAQRREQNQAILERHLAEIDAKDQNKVTLQIRQRAAEIMPSDPDNPQATEIAAQQLRNERAQKQELAQSRVELNKKRLTQIDANIESARARIDIAKQRLGAAQATHWDKDPQVKGAWAKVSQYKEQAKTLRTQAAIAYSKGDEDGAKILEAQAEIAESTMQGVINNIEQRVNYLNGGVRLPNPPGRKSGVKLTEAEIRAAGGSDKDVEEARRKGVLAGP